MSKVLKFALSILLGSTAFLIITSVMLFTGLGGLALISNPVHILAKIVGWMMYIGGTVTFVHYIRHMRGYWAEQYRSYFPRRPEVTPFRMSL